MPLKRLAATFVLLISGANAQWLNYPTPGIPRLPNGKPNLAARIAARPFRLAIERGLIRRGEIATL